MNESKPQTSGRSPHGINVRSIKPVLSLNTKKYWFDGNPFVTSILNSLSFLFPPGEETFVNSVNHYRERIKDPTLRLAIKGFASQEFMHSHLHEKLNEWIWSVSPSSKVYAQRITKFIEFIYKQQKKLSPKAALAITAGFEHLTAIMAMSLLEREDVLDKMEPEIRNIFVLHAVEEIEHKNVAFDVYKKIGGGNVLRVWGIVAASSLLFAMTTFTAASLLYHDRKALSLAHALIALKLTIGPQGFFTSLIPNYLKYFRPSFHPSQLQDQELIADWTRKLGDMTEVKVIGKTKVTTNLSTQEVGA